jgi:sugar transferase (PEP-CTERM/EpsH1 system associated)
VTDRRHLIAHVLHRFDTGGLENGVVNLINRLPPERFGHVVIALTEVTDFRLRIQRDDVRFVALGKPPGQGLWQFGRMRRLFDELRPTVVHTRNLAALEMSAPATWAGVPVRIHGEHGWDVNDPDGRSRKFRFVRRFYRPFVHQYVALSRHLQRYLLDHVGLPAARVTQIYNGVDAERFHPARGERPPVAGSPFNAPELWRIGSVGRLQAVKNPVLLARAFLRALEWAPDTRARLRLVMAGEGAERQEVESVLRQGGAHTLAWMAGERGDVPELMRGLDAFALPSLAEGVSNTILEAMATALPIVATRVGGNDELLEDGTTGRLVPPRDVDAMARALLDDFRQPDAARERGQRARRDGENRFSLDAMVSGYADLYDRLIARVPAGDRAQRGRA